MVEVAMRVTDYAGPSLVDSTITTTGVMIGIYEPAEPAA
jgi:hypothetical protein